MNQLQLFGPAPDGESIGDDGHRLDAILEDERNEPTEPVVDPATRHAIRRTATLVALLPLSIILGVKAANLVGDPWLNAYGIGVLATTMVVMFVSFTYYEDPADRPPLSDDEPLVSFMLAVKDEVAVIEMCVRSILDGTYRNVEVIVIDDASSDGTAEILAEMAQGEDRLRVMTMDTNGGKKRALTAGARTAKGDLLAFTDSDCVLAPDALECCVNAFLATPDLGALSGHARALNADRNLLTRTQDVWYDGQFAISKAGESVFGAVSCVSGPLAVFRREAILSYLPAWSNDQFLGRDFPFATDRQLTGYVLGQRWRGMDLLRKYRDDPLVAREAQPPRRWRAEYSRSARVWTNVPATTSGLFRQQVRWKKSFIRNLFFTGTFYWRIHPVTSLLYYAHVLWVFAAPLMAFRHLVWLPLHGAWLVTALYFAGVTLKGCVWAAAYAIQNPGDHRWIYRPLMNVIGSLALSWLLLWSIPTLRRGTWSREVHVGEIGLPAATA